MKTVASCFVMTLLFNFVAPESFYCQQDMYDPKLGPNCAGSPIVKIVSKDYNCDGDRSLYANPTKCANSFGTKFSNSLLNHRFYVPSVPSVEIDPPNDGHEYLRMRFFYGYYGDVTDCPRVSHYFSWLIRKEYVKGDEQSALCLPATDGSGSKFYMQGGSVIEKVWYDSTCQGDRFFYRKGAPGKCVVEGSYVGYVFEFLSAKDSTNSEIESGSTPQFVSDKYPASSVLGSTPSIFVYPFMLLLLVVLAKFFMQYAVNTNHEFTKYRVINTATLDKA
jgi:hypothetical protein